MNKNNKKIILIILILAVIITVTLFLIFRKKDNNDNKDNNEGYEKIYNTSETIKEEYSINNMRFDEISYYYLNPETYITFNATNTGSDDVTFGYFTITIKDKNGTEMAKLLANIDTPLKSGEVKEMQLSTLGNFVEGYTLEFEKFEEEFLEVTE